MYLRIANDGEIELAALFLLGASTKEGDSSKIGFFGSGNKYAIATLLRKGIGLRIFSGTKEIALKTRKVDFRGEHFDQIILDGEPTSFTTRMGPTWETWFALREFVCNAIDEGGFEIGLTSDVVGVEGSTTIFITYAPEVAHFFGHIDDYIFLGTPIFEAKSSFGKVAITANDVEKLNVYRKGVCILPEAKRSPALFHYNFDEIQINESRVYVLEYELLERIATALALAPAVIVQRFLNNVSQDELAENRAYWQYVNDAFSPAWEEALREQSIMPANLSSYAPAEDVLSSIILPEELVKKLSKQFPKLHVWGQTGGQYREVPYEGDEILRACAEATTYGYLAEGVQLKTVLFDKDGVMASYNQKTNTIAIDVRYAEDYDELVTTVIEEGLHAKGYNDGTRSFEQYLLRELVAAKRKEVTQ